MFQTPTEHCHSLPFGAQGSNISTSSTLLVNPRDAARAMSVSERTLFTLTKRGDIPAVRIGRAVRYDLEDLKAFVQRSKDIARGK